MRNFTLAVTVGALFSGSAMAVESIDFGQKVEQMLNAQAIKYFGIV